MSCKFFHFSIFFNHFKVLGDYRDVISFVMVNVQVLFSRNFSFGYMNVITSLRQIISINSSEMMGIENTCFSIIAMNSSEISREYMIFPCK